MRLSHVDQISTPSAVAVLGAGRDGGRDQVDRWRMYNLFPDLQAV